MGAASTRPHEQNFLADLVTLRVLSVQNLEHTIVVLSASVSGNFRSRYEFDCWLKTQLETLPAEFYRQSLALAAPRFRTARESGWFEFELHPEESAG